jgi:hypothetical protein
MSKSKQPKITAPEAPKLPALPARRARRRSTRPSHSWCFRQPPSRKRVTTACARGLPPAPVPALQPTHAPQGGMDH